MANKEVIFNNDDTLKDIERTLGGVIEVEKGVWKRKDESALLSKDGVVKVMAIIKIHFNKVMYLSDLTPLFVRNKRKAIFCAIYKTLHKNKKAYGITDAATIAIITECIDSAIYSSMRQAVNGMTSMRFYNSLRQDVKMGDNQNHQGMTGI